MQAPMYACMCVCMTTCACICTHVYYIPYGRTFPRSQIFVIAVDFPGNKIFVIIISWMNRKFVKNSLHKKNYVQLTSQHGNHRNWFMYPRDIMCTNLYGPLLVERLVSHCQTFFFHFSPPRRKMEKAVWPCKTMERCFHAPEKLEIDTTWSLFCDGQYRISQILFITASLLLNGSLFWFQNCNNTLICHFYTGQWHIMQ